MVAIAAFLFSTNLMIFNIYDAPTLRLSFLLNVLIDEYAHGLHREGI